MFGDVDNPGEAPLREGQPEGTDLEIKPQGDSGNEEPSPTEGELDVDLNFVEGEIPTELQPRYKEMQAGLTRKFQEVAELRKQAGNPEMNQKAVLFDKIFSTPQGEQLLATLMAGGEEASDVPVEDDSEGNELHQTVDRRLEPTNKRLQQLETQMKQQAVKAEKAAFLEAHPNWEQEVGKAAMESVWRENPTLTMESAYKLAAYDKAVARQATRAKQKNAGIEKPGTPRTGVREEGQAQSVAEAAKQAYAELKREGYAFREGQRL